MKNCKDNKGKKIAAIALSAVVGANAPINVSAATVDLNDIFHWNYQHGNKLTVMSVPSVTSGGAVETQAPEVTPSQMPVSSNVPSQEPSESKAPVSSERPLATMMPITSKEPQASEGVCWPSEEVKPGMTAGPCASPDVLTSAAPPMASDDVLSSSKPIVGDPDGSGSSSSKPPLVDADPVGSPEVAPTKVPQDYPIIGPNHSQGIPDAAPTQAPVQIHPLCPPAGYMPGDADFLPGFYQIIDENGQSRWVSGEYYDYYYLKQYNSEQVVLPGTMSGLLPVEKQTRSRKSRDVKWGDARTKDINKLSKEGTAIETIPGTGDADQSAWIFSALAGSAALVTAFYRKKKENSNET